MNGLTLRISKGGGRNRRNAAGFKHLEITSFVEKSVLEKNILFRNFVQSSSADVQLVILKTILDGDMVTHSEETIRFLVIVFLHAEPKHPVKCFLTRHVTKNTTIQHPFSVILATYINSTITQHHKDYIDYMEAVSKLPACVENFPTGVAAVKIVEVELAGYLKTCLECCVGALRDTEITKTVSPTEKNQIFNLAHLSLRLLLYIVQKISDENITNLSTMFKEVRSLIKYLLFDEDVPMDTKSVCGILYLSMHILDNGSDSWVNILNPQQNDDELNQLLFNDASQLAVYSAIATVVAVDRLQQETFDQQPAITALTLKILSIGERNLSESTFTLGATRTLLHISKSLNGIADNAVGLTLVDRLLVFVWAHLEHYMDSVRHLTAQILGCIVKYSANLRRDGDDKALNNLFTALSLLEKSRKSYYVSLTSLTVELGAASVMERLPHVIREVIQALDMQAVQASATTALETLLQKHVQETSTEIIYRAWIEPILSHVATNVLESGVLNILENLLARAVKLNDNIMDFILPYIKQSCDPHTQTHDLKCILMLLSVARKSGVTERLGSERSGEWKGVISYEVLRMAAVDAIEETRILSLSLIVESPKTTEVFTQGDLQFVLYYLKYNINAQSPNFRQLTLSMMKKFIKRLEDSYKVVRRQKDLQVDYYLTFLEGLRAQCFDSLIPGANYSRRLVALQVLAWCERDPLDGYDRIWKEEYVEKLLLHLEDSYENNKSLALEILEKCPTDLIKDKHYTISLNIEDLLRQASSLKPTDCISAAYKLNLLKNKLPDCVLQGEVSNTAEAATYSLLRRLLAALLGELVICERSIVSGAGRAPMYGLLHCIGHLVTRLDVCAISNDADWTALVGEVVATCMRVNAAVAGVVNNSSPEGHLPMDMTGVVVSDHGNSGGVRLEDGRQVTAQMVLLCAWRSVKEVSLLLGEMSSRLTIAEEETPHGTLTADQLLAVGEHFTSLLAETKHRGAFEQAYVGFTKLLTRLWRCRSPALHELPRAWLTELMAAIASGDKKGTLCATRRSAGLPFMIQALVTTELQVLGNPKCFHHCMGTLLRLARSRAASETAIETRTHSINIVRALFRNAALDESVAPYVGEGLVVALHGFEGGTWVERNSSTLLFSALMVRVFGVQRSRDAERLCVRNRMTGRIFFLRYPTLYDYMLEKLKEVSSSEDFQILRPSLYPILLLLARLYPSSLEGTVSNLRLVAYIPHVLACAKSSVLKTRQLAAKAMVPLISPEQYIPHLEAMLQLIRDKDIKRNYCHGILLQLIRLLDARPETLVIESEATSRLQKHIGNTLWIIEQVVGDKACYLLADEYVKVVNLIIWRCPGLINDEVINKIEIYLEKLLFDKEEPRIYSGRHICLANALYLYLVILNKCNLTEKICELVSRSLTHNLYEVILSVLNYLLILYGNLEIENKFQEFLYEISNTEVLKKLRENQMYIELLCKVLESTKCLECGQKALKILTLEEETEKHIVEMKFTNKNTTDDIIIQSLFDFISNEHENLVHIYLGSLSNFVTKRLKTKDISASKMLDVINVFFTCSSSDNNEETRTVVVEFLERNCEELLKFDLDGLNEEGAFEYKATIFASIVRLLEDDSSTLRQRVSNTITKIRQAGSRDVISSRAAEELREWLAGGQSHVLVVLALVDFNSEVCVTDDVSDECRVFDHNERYNIFLEETTWTNECANKIVQSCNTKPVEFVQNVVNNPLYRRTFEKLCNNNLSLFENLVKSANKRSISNNVINPKVELFIEKLCTYK